jgi:hypothetical protein
MNEQHDVFSDTWAARDALGRELPDQAEVGAPRPERKVGIFYFICNIHGGKEAPLDVSKVIAANPGNFAFEPGKGYYWGEPELGYYRSTDPWVIRRHAYQLADAGVDTLIFDLTNDVTFPESYRAVCEVFTQMRAEGERTPDICFLASERAILTLWDDFYSKGLYSELWFRWKGKPLLIFGQWEKRGPMYDVRLPQHIKDFFTIRLSWAWDSLSWYDDAGQCPLEERGKHRWPWVAHHPQCVGWDQPGVPEYVPVAVGQHPLSGIGRSFHAGKQPAVNEYDCTPDTPRGLHFQEQWEHALRVDPEFIFVTGWNEWTAGSALCEDPGYAALQALWDFFPGANLGRATRELKKGDVYFIDQYNQEFSRDAEPMRGGHSDNYYYQLAANIRRFKGVRALPKASPATTIDLAGGFEQWDAVQPEYRDHLYETLPRDEPGSGNTHYTWTSGRNEFVKLKVARDALNLYFYAETRESISPSSDPNWMMLFLRTGGERNWLGYNYLINWPADDTRSGVLRCRGGWDWERVNDAELRVAGNRLALAVPRAALGLAQKPLDFEFHWCDNLQNPGDETDFLTHGDSAPARRFNYHFSEAA